MLPRRLPKVPLWSGRPHRVPARQSGTHAGASQSIETSQPEDARPYEQTAKEIEVTEKLRKRFPGSDIEVADTSGQCGRSFAISVASKDFAGLSMVKQHQLVSKALEQDIAEWHAVQFKTVPK